MRTHINKPDGDPQHCSSRTAPLAIVPAILSTFLPPMAGPVVNGHGSHLRLCLPQSGAWIIAGVRAGAGISTKLLTHGYQHADPDVWAGFIPFGLPAVTVSALSLVSPLPLVAAATLVLAPVSAITIMPGSRRAFATPTEFAQTPGRSSDKPVEPLQRNPSYAGQAGSLPCFRPQCSPEQA